jgi:hypothetical protein
MTLPTPEQLRDETQRRYASSPDSHAGVPADAVEPAWLRIREEILCEWTEAAFNAFFPTAGNLDAGDTVLIEYWTDIKMQIAGEAGRWSWDNPPDPAP